MMKELSGVLARRTSEAAATYQRPIIIKKLEYTAAPPSSLQTTKGSSSDSPSIVTVPHITSSIVENSNPEVLCSQLGLLDSSADSLLLRTKVRNRSSGRCTVGTATFAVRHTPTICYKIWVSDGKLILFSEVIPPLYVK